MNILLYFIYGKDTIYILIHSNKIYLCIRKYLPNKYFFHYSIFSPEAYYIVSANKILAVVCLILFFLYSSSLHFICYNLLISLSLPSLKVFLPSLFCSLLWQGNAMMLLTIIELWNKKTWFTLIYCHIETVFSNFLLLLGFYFII